MREYMTKLVQFEEFKTKRYVGTGDLRVVGYGSVYEKRDYHNDVMKRGCFKLSLEKHTQRGSRPEMLYEHKNRTCGTWEVFEERDYGLWLEGVVENTEKNADIVEKILNGNLCGLSIGFYKLEAHKTKAGVTNITQAHLVETSLVTYPANNACFVSPTTHDIIHTGPAPRFG